LVAVIILVLLVGLALAYVLTPLRRGVTDGPQDARAELEAEATAKKDAALGAIVDVEIEHEVGKLSPIDFEALRRDYEAEALAALKELDTIRLSDRSGASLESEIAAARARRSCPACGASRVPGDPCPRCGT
jgi:hypothetical protein